MARQNDTLVGHVTRVWRDLGWRAPECKVGMLCSVCLP